jgi:hypothetical protein
MDLLALQHLKTVKVESKLDISIAARLSRYYERQALNARKLDKLVNSDWWSSAELLSDMVKVARSPFDERKSVAFLLIEECNHRNATTDPQTDLLVTSFAIDPWYSTEDGTEIAVKWADYRITQAVEYLGRIDKVIWPVDERNVPVQLILRDLHYKILDYDRTSEIIAFTR